MSNSRKTVYLVTRPPSYAFLKREERDEERERARDTVLSVVANRTFEKIASKKLGTSSSGTSNGGETRGSGSKMGG